VKIFNKSLTSELIATAGATFMILVGIVVAQRAGYLVRIAAKGWIPNDAITTLLGFSMIKFLPLIFSVTVFLAVLMTLSRMHRDSEMAIWFSSGLSVTAWIKPVLRFTLPVAILISILSAFITPWATDKVEEYQAHLKSRDELASLSPGVFKESNRGERVYFIESFDELGNVVKNIFVQSIQHNKTGVIVANQGRREKAKNGDSFIVLEKGRRYETKPSSAEVSTTEFERYAIRVETKEVVHGQSSANAKSTKQLLASNSDTDKAELQWRFALPIATLVMAFLAIPLSYVDPRAGRSLNMMFAILICIIYYNLLSIFEAWISQGKIHVWLGLWPIHLFFIALAAYMFYRRNHLLPLIPQVFGLILPVFRKMRGAK